LLFHRFIPLDYYVCFWIPYFYYDTWADYKVYVSKRANEMADKDFLSRVKLFVKYQPLMVLHHFFLPMVYGPALLVSIQTRTRVSYKLVPECLTITSLSVFHPLLG